MKKNGLLKLLICAISSTFSLNAQNVTLTKGSSTNSFEDKAESQTLNFTAGETRYFINKNFEMANMDYQLKSFNSKGMLLADTKMHIERGVMGNTYSIDDVIHFGTSAYTLVRHTEKGNQKNTLLARVIDNLATISEKETELIDFHIEKMMNPGQFHSSISPDNKTMAILGELPYAKDQSAALKIALYDPSLKKIKEGEVTLPGEDTKNKTLHLKVANDGTVYIIKRTTTRIGEIALKIYQWSAKNPTDLKEYVIETSEPNQIFNYVYEVNQNNEIIVSGLIYIRKTLSMNDVKATAAFYFTNKNKSEKVFTTFNLDGNVDNLTARKILVNDNTVFLIAEQYKSEKLPIPAGTPAGTKTVENFNYTHQGEYVIAMDFDGNKKFQLNVGKNFTARNFDKQYYSAYFICNDKLTIVYNDQKSKYKENYTSEYEIVPVLVQITNDGLLQSPVVFIENPKMEVDYVLYPSYVVQDTPNQLSFLMKKNSTMNLLTIKIE